MFFKISAAKKLENFTGKHLLEFLFNKVAACNFNKSKLQRMCFPLKFFYRTLPVAASKNNEQQQLFEGFANSC